ncbi:MAG: CDP-archaeol synthase [Alphaproteobacteria bacterium]|nr:CDP-archaeol synthase [Alphaproteobacteria bacterium]MBL6937003.1 CDP-archaeol synthase [Alphaproteobacteria bacterium]MBL7097772.1 CDP-archaeol synthase [Alphaproteobacteria bacterium]
MHTRLALEVLALVGVANSAPVLAKRILGPRALPIDGDRSLADGHALFGPSKTWRGIVAAILATAVAASLIGLSGLIGAVLATAAMAGDLCSSFIKRRLGLAPSSICIGLDQVPESLLPALCAAHLLFLSVVDVVVIVAAFFVCEIVVSRIMFEIGVRDTPA